MSVPRSADGRTFQATIGGRTIDLSFTSASEVVVDGRRVDCTFVPSGQHGAILLVDGRSVTVAVELASNGIVFVTADGRRMEVHLKDERELLLDRFGLSETKKNGDAELRAPMPGLVLAVEVEPGQSVAAGDGLLVLEAMKMENELRAPADGVVKAIHVSVGDAVGKNDLLIEFDS
jgi:biotin carboxyl carrier protein